MRKNVWYAVLHQAEAERVIQGFRSDDLLLLAARAARGAELKTEIRYAEVVENVDPEWLFPNNVLGVEDDFCSRCSVLEKVIDLSFGFNLPIGAFVDNFELDVKCGSTIIQESLWMFLWTGSEFSYFKTINYGLGFPPCVDTIFHGWRSLPPWYFTRDRVNGMIVRVQHDQLAGGGGGVPTQLWSSYVDALKMRVSYY